MCHEGYVRPNARSAECISVQDCKQCLKNEEYIPCAKCVDLKCDLFLKPDSEDDYLLDRSLSNNVNVLNKNNKTINKNNSKIWSKSNKDNFKHNVLNDSKHYTNMTGSKTNIFNRNDVNRFQRSVNGSKSVQRAQLGVDYCAESVTSCFCKLGFARDKNGVCIPVRECKNYRNGKAAIKLMKRKTMCAI